MADQVPAISGVEDQTKARIMLYQSGRSVHAPMDQVGYQPLDADLTSWAAITRASGFDTFVATPSSANLAALVTDEGGSDKLLFGTPFVTYTPTFTGFGTPSGVSIWSRRVGDSLHIRGKFVSGTVTAVEARMTLGFNGTNGSINSDATKVASIQLAGTLVLNGATPASFYTLIESNVGYITFSTQSATANALAKLNGTGLGTGTTISLTAEIPISGW